MIPGSSGTVTYISQSGIATRSTTLIPSRPLPIAIGSSIKPGSRSNIAVLTNVRIFGTLDFFTTAVFAVNTNSGAIATCR